MPLHKISHHTDLFRGPLLRKVPAQKEAILKDHLQARDAYQFFKRAIDIIFSILVILGVLSWLTPVVALLIFFDSKGPVFFVQPRVGKNGRLFRCIKFRTMIVNAEADERQAEENDERITRPGRFLRKTNIDEIPQFFNILTGDMSLVGPRPHMLADCTRFSFVIPAYQFRTLVRPGITGLAQVKGHHGPTLTYERIFMRYHWDAEYIRHANLWLDLKILLLTLSHTLSNILRLGGSFLTANNRGTI